MSNTHVPLEELAEALWIIRARIMARTATQTDIACLMAIECCNRGRALKVLAGETLELAVLNGHSEQIYQAVLEEDEYECQ